MPWKRPPDEDEYTREMDAISHAIHGEHEAFRLLVQRYEQRLIAYLTQMLGDHELARDLTQETFVAAYRALPRWQPPATPTASPLAPWLYRIATNRALSLIRQHHDEASPWDKVVAHLPTPGIGVEDQVVARLLLRQALQSLSDDDAACLVLHFVAGERYGEIATRLGLTGEAVRKRVARGLVALRAAYLALDTEVRS